MNDTAGHGNKKSLSEGGSVRTRTDPLSLFQACQGQQRGESARGGKVVKLTHASQDVDEASKTTVRTGERSESGREIREKGAEGSRARGTTVDLSNGVMGNNTSDKNKRGMPRTLKSVEPGRTGGARGLHRDSSSGDENSEGEREQIPTNKTRTASNTNTTKTTVRAGERNESGREIEGEGGGGDRARGTTVDLSDGLMGTNASDKSRRGMPRTPKSVEPGRTGEVRGLYRDSSSGDENSEGIPTKKTNTSNRTNTTKTTKRAGERSESGREIGGKGGEGGRARGTTVDLSDGLMM